VTAALVDYRIVDIHNPIIRLAGVDLHRAGVVRADVIGPEGVSASWGFLTILRPVIKKLITVADLFGGIRGRNDVHRDSPPRA
jgi:hypothetical protein